MNIPIPKCELNPSTLLVNNDDHYGVPEMMKNETSSAVNGKSNSVSRHPVQAAEENRAKFGMDEEILLAQRMFGRSLAQQLSLEFDACRQVGRLPGPMCSSKLMAETLMGTDDYIGFESFLNNPVHDEKMYDICKSMRDMK